MLVVVVCEYTIDSFCLYVDLKIESAIHCVSGGAVIKGLEAMAVASLMLFVESLQVNIKAAIKLDEGSRSRLTTLTETVSASCFFAIWHLFITYY
jgi:hypothetical protein